MLGAVELMAFPSDRLVPHFAHTPCQQSIITTNAIANMEETEDRQVAREYVDLSYCMCLWGWYVTQGDYYGPSHMSV